MNGTDARAQAQRMGRPAAADHRQRVASTARSPLRLAGAEAAVKSARTTLGGEVVDAVEAERFWAGLREQTDPFFAAIAPKAALWRLALPSITEPLQLPGAQLMEWGGAQRWWITDTDAQTVRISAKQAGGHATIFRTGAGYDRSAGVFTPLPAPLMKIHRGLKAAFDPGPHLQSRPSLPRLLSSTRCKPISPTSSATRPMATRPTPSCASACIAASARRPARPTSCSATNSTARAGAST